MYHDVEYHDTHVHGDYHHNNIILFGASLSEPRIHEVQEAVLYVYILVCMFVG